MPDVRAKTNYEEEVGRGGLRLQLGVRTVAVQLPVVIPTRPDIVPALEADME